MKWGITITGTQAAAAARPAEEKNKQVILKNYPPFTDCITEINNMLIDNVKDLHH